MPVLGSASCDGNEQRGSAVPLRRLIRDGKLPAIKFGNKWLVDKTMLDQFASSYDGRPGNKATLF
jgi:hypothetical protein